MDRVSESRRRLIALLQLAYSGERAAAYAYQGHWRSLRLPEEIRRVREIEAEEWHHRRLVGEILEKLGSGPLTRLELKDIVVGRIIGFLCHIGGWFIPMYGAGKLERGNIVEYEHAARHARDCGRTEFVDCLLMMAEVEWEHEQYFRARVESHFFGRLVPMWPAPPPKAHIRASFAAEEHAPA